jgi:hypothetical protein
VLACAAASLLLLSANNREALTRAGIPLANKLPDLGISRGIQGWRSRWTSASDRDDTFGLDDEPYLAGQKNEIFEDVGAIVHPDDPLADAPIGAPLEHVGNSRYEDSGASDGYVQPQIEIGETPVYHPTNGYMILPDHETLAQKPLARHPIVELRDRAKREWDAKLARQSKTLEDAVNEYRRRYKRRPPIGFDKWFEYATKHNVILTDEYDQIFKDLQPFWALCALFALLLCLNSLYFA